MMTTRRRKPETVARVKQISEEELPPAALKATSVSHYLWPLPIFRASNVLACDESYWNSGTYAPASILIDIGTAPVYVTRMALLVVMVPNMGKVRHQIRVGLTPSALHSVCWYNGVTYDGEWMQIQLCDTSDLRRTSRFVEITTHESPSFIAWRRIRVWKAAV